MAANSAGPAQAQPAGNGNGSAITRNPSFRIALPASNTAAATAPTATSPGPVPVNLASSPGASTTTSTSLFGGLNRGFRRNRGHSTTRTDSGLPLPSPPALSSPAFPALGASMSHQDHQYFDGDHDQNSTTSNNNTSALSSSIPASGARGYFARRGFARKMTGGSRTPTGEAPPPLRRSRSSSQPTHPANSSAQNQNNANISSGNAPQNPATATGSFFPPQPAGPPATAASTHSSANNEATDSRRPVTAGATGSSISTATPTVPAPAPAAATNTTSSSPSSSAVQHIRLVPHLESTRSLTFEPVSRDVVPTIPLRIGRFTDRNPSQPISAIDQHRVAFKSKVVSRTHAEIWYDTNPTSAYNGTSQVSSSGWFIRDLKSSSGTFLNHIRLSGAGMESRPFPLRDGDLLQLGVDYQGGTEEIYRCVKMRVELNRGWQRQANSFNTNALRQIRALGNVSDSATPTSDSPADGSTSTNTKKSKSKRPSSSRKDTLSAPSSAAAAAAKKASSAQQASGVTDCCICLYSVTVYQALFIAPCSHIFHFKCIYPLLTKHHPGFECPLCRTFADLEADVEQDDVVEAVEEEEEEEEEASSADEDEENAEPEEEAIARARAVGEAKLLPDIPSDDTGLAAAVAAVSSSSPSSVEASGTAGPASSEAQVVQDTLASTSDAFVNNEGNTAEDSAFSASHNLETLRPGRKSPMIQQLPSPSQSQTQMHAREESSFPGQSAEDASIVNYGTSTPRVNTTTSTTRRTSNHISARNSLEEGLPSGSGAGTSSSSSFYPPSAGDFDPDMRRTSIYVQGADGHAMSIPVTGRSRPGSLYDMDMSDSNINPNVSASTSPAQQNRDTTNRARSVKGLRMSRGSRTSLRDSTSSHHIPQPQAIPADTTNTSPGPSSASMVHSRTGTEYHDSADRFGSDDEDWEIPLTATAPAASLPSELEASPTSVFTAPLATLSPETQSLGPSISPNIQPLNLGQSHTPSATPSSRSVDDLNERNTPSVDVKGKGVAHLDEIEGSEGSGSGSSDVGMTKRLVSPARAEEGASL